MNSKNVIISIVWAEADAYAQVPLDAGELSLAAIADWGPAEEWSA